MDDGKHGVHDNFAVTGFTGALFSIFDQIAADAFSLITSINSHLHQADFFVIDRCKNQSADQFVIEAFNAADVEIVGFFGAVMVQKFEPQRFKQNFIAEFDQFIIT